MITPGQWTITCGKDTTTASSASKKAFLTHKVSLSSSRLETCWLGSIKRCKFGDMKKARTKWIKLAATGFSHITAMEARSSSQGSTWAPRAKRDYLCTSKRFKPRRTRKSREEVPLNLMLKQAQKKVISGSRMDLAKRMEQAHILEIISARSEAFCPIHLTCSSKRIQWDNSSMLSPRHHSMLKEQMLIKLRKLSLEFLISFIIQSLPPWSRKVPPIPKIKEILDKRGMLSHLAWAMCPMVGPS